MEGTRFIRRDASRQPFYSVAILAGGESGRMGRNKALEPLGGKPVISHIIDSLSSLTSDIFIVANDVATYEGFGLPVCADHYSQQASLVGVYSALAAARNDLCFTVACDMPFAEPALVELLAGSAAGNDAVVPVSQRGLEPLFAVYSRRCLGPMRVRIEKGELAIRDALDGLKVRLVEMPEMVPLCDTNMVFLNVNTVVELEEASLMVPRVSRRREEVFFTERMSGRPPLICFVGRKDSGKTTFLEKIIPELGRRGVRVACIKHDVHGFTMDREGTDTWRLVRAGARKVTIASPEAVASLEDVDDERSLTDLHAAAGADIDLVLAEGFKRSAADKIEISRGVGFDSLVCPEEELVAVISDRPDAARTIPVFEIDDVEAVANLLMIRYGLGGCAGDEGGQ